MPALTSALQLRRQPRVGVTTSGVPCRPAACMCKRVRWYRRRRKSPVHSIFWEMTLHSLVNICLSTSTSLSSPLMSEPLRVLDSVIKRSCGARFEADVFSLLRSSAFVARCFEFSGGDGVVDCTSQYDVSLNWAQRHLLLSDQEGLERRVLLFDVKSSAAVAAGQQQFESFFLQRAIVAFYVCVCAADPSWVEVIPNYGQDREIIEHGEYVVPDAREIALRAVVNITRTSWFPPLAYGMLDPCGTPYRMPRWMLSEAVTRMRACALGQQVYVNPWNEQAFPSFHPLTTQLMKWAEPSEETMQFTAYKEVTEVMRAFKYRGSMIFDFVWLQPRLADFKLDNFLVQHKLDTEARAEGKPFDDVLVARDTLYGRSFYFNAFERFDFLMYQFEYSGLPRRKVFFFVPERELPDELFLSPNKRHSFECLPREFFHVMDSEMRWVLEVEDTIRRYPQPRGAQRPAREDEILVDEDTTNSQVDEVSSEDAALAEVDEDGAQPDGKVFGRIEHATAMQTSIRRFYHDIMNECAARRSGLLVVLSRNHPIGDMWFCRYRWSSPEVQDWLGRGRPPQFAHSLPSLMVGIGICYFARHRETSFLGPPLTAAQFRRLNSCAKNRLLVFDLGGPDGALTPVILPSDDLTYTEEQRRIFTANLGLKKHIDEWEAKTPHMSSLLKTGLFLSEYLPPSGLGSQDARVWQLLTTFVQHQPFQHPHGFQRNPDMYRCSIRTTNEMLVSELIRGTAVKGDVKREEGPPGGDASEGGRGGIDEVLPE